MLRLDRYILRDLLSPFVAGTVVFLAVVIANTIVKSSEQIFALQTPARLILLWLAYRVPFFLIAALPVGAMLATNLTVIRLGRDNEINPVRMGGMSLRRFVAPFLAFGLACSLASFGINEFLVPSSTARANRILADSILRAPDQVIQANKTFRTAGEAFCHVGEVNMQANLMTFVLIYRFERGVPREALAAAVARRVGRQWYLERGQQSHFDEQGRFVSAVAFDSYPVEFADNLVSLWDEDQSPERLTFAQGYERLRLLTAAGDTLGATAQRYHLHRRVAMPLLCVILVLLAAPLSLRFARPQANQMLGLVLTIILVFFANGTINWAEVMALAGSSATLPPAVAAWLPVILFGGLGAGLMWQVDRSAG